MALTSLTPEIDIYLEGIAMAGRSGKRRPWIGLVEGMEMACISFRPFKRLVEQGRIGTLRIEGVGKTFYSREDIESLITNGTRPARERKVVEA